MELLKRFWRWLVEMEDKYGCFGEPSEWPNPDKKEPKDTPMDDLIKRLM